MWGRLVEKWLQLFSDGVPWAGPAPIPARKIRQQSSAELGIVARCLLLPGGLVVWFCKSNALMCRPSSPVPLFLYH